MKKWSVWMLLLAVVFGSCKKYPVDEPFKPKVIVPVDSNLLPHFFGTIDSTDFRLIAGGNGYANFSINGKNAATPPDSPSVTFVSSLSRTGQPALTLTIKKKSLRYDPAGSPTDAAFEAFFAPGPQNFASSFSDGMVVEWIDASSKTWSSANGAQLNGLFDILSANKRYLSGVTVLDVKCSFSCTLYDSQGNALLLQSSEFYGTFKNN